VPIGEFTQETWRKEKIMRRLIPMILAIMAVQGLLAAGEASAFFRADAWVDSEPGIRIFVREIKVSMKEEVGSPVLLIHGGGPGSLPNFDPTVPNYSLAEDIAGAGHDVYMMDVRGFGHSTRPKAMDITDEKAPPAVPSDEAVKDISAVVDWILRRSRESKTALVGLGAGGHWAALYTTKNSDRVSHLVLLNALYGTRAPWKKGKAFEDPKNPGAFNPGTGAFFLADARGLMADWDGAIPGGDKSQWRDPRVAVAYVTLALAGDATAKTRTPPSIRIPGAFRKEHFEMSQGKKYWDAKDILVPTLYVRGTLDDWSRPEDMQSLHKELVNAPQKQFVVIHDATHFLHLDRPEKGRAAFIQELLVFLGSRQPADKAGKK
jgi:pimeloyl-ACP methyl ester carboxylesterase